jgi:ribonuclease Z
VEFYGFKYLPVPFSPMLEIVFLGTSGSVPTTQRGMPAIAVKSGSELLLWDCGEGTQRQMMRYQVGYGSIDAIMITHPHMDHFLGMYGLLETIKLSTVHPKPLKIIAPSGLYEPLLERYLFAEVSKMRKGVMYEGKDFTVSAFPVTHCKASYGLLFQERDRRKFYGEKAHSLGLHGRLFQEIQEKGAVTVNGKLVTLEEVSYLKQGRRIVYAGDGRPSDTTIEAAKEADLLIHEGTFDPSKEDDAKERMHSTVAEAAKIAKKAKAKQLVITHISPRYSDVKELEAEARKIFKNTVFAVDGMGIRP